MTDQDLFTLETIKERNMKPVTLPDGTQTDTWSKEYMLYCEALNLSKKPIEKRREWLNRLKNKDRVEGLKTWLRLIWKNKN
jgi:hypothetical protein